MQEKTAFVTGSTGFTGGALCARLVERGYRVIAFTRASSNTEYLRSLGVTLTVGDLRDPQSIRSAMQGASVVFHVGAAFREARLPDQTYLDVNVTGTRNVIEAAHACQVARVVHCSTIGVHGDTGGTPAREDSPFAPPDYYCKTKLEGELLARELFERLGVEGVVFRPAGIYGPRDTRFLKLFRSIKQGHFIRIGNCTPLYHMTYIDDLCDGIIRCAEVPQAAGEVFMLAGDTHTTIEELFAAVAAAVGGKCLGGHIPMWLIMTAAHLCEALCRPLRLQPPLYPRRVEFFSKNRAADISKARRVLQYQPRISLAEGLRRTADWYAARGLV